ncbi:Oligopeptide transporter OPT superfamily [Arabidopsis suecica]|uniref:Oligopeptide transporter OPT superfamily n=1 Tax=Arabidopsis suecica TaxID=45249 RepID=A0A8T2FCP5_ARASU|nr:Oligopeptide transporter OPT superfamily [Arabidopsis suecica]
MGRIITPLTFWLFWTAFHIGDPDGLYKAPYAVIYREMVILGIKGFAKLPKHCLTLCCKFFIAALIVNLIRDITPPKISKLIPLPMAMAGPFLHRSLLHDRHVYRNRDYVRMGTFE